MKRLRVMLAASFTALATLAGSATEPADSVTASDMDLRMESAGMVDAGALDDAVIVDMMYARADNFTGARMYPEGFATAWLHPEAARALARAQAELSATHPGLRLLVKDAARPMSVQRLMYRTVRGTPQAPYVSNPANGGGLHNYGLAVDVTIADPLGRELPMGTPVDHLGREANIDREDDLVARGLITREERQNRQLLRRVMKAAGWKTLRSEWWHFNLRSRSEARRDYPLLDF